MKTPNVHSADLNLGFYLEKVRGGLFSVPNGNTPRIYSSMRQDAIVITADLILDAMRNTKPQGGASKAQQMISHTPEDFARAIESGTGKLLKNQI